MKILFNFLDYNHNEVRKEKNTYGGIGYYRIVKPAQFIEGHEKDVFGKEAVHFGRNNLENWTNVFKKYDAVWMNYGYGDQNLASIIFAAQQSKKKLIMDVDDNYLDIPESNDLHEQFKEKKKDRAFLSAALSFCDTIVVSTEPLKEKLFEHFKKVHGMEKNIVVIPNMNDIRDWEFTPVEKTGDIGDKLVIGYTGSTSHKDDFQMIAPVLAKLMKKYKNLHLEIVGMVKKTDVADYFGSYGFTQESLERISLLPATLTFKEYPEYLSKLKWDIGIAPLVDTAFTRAKSHIKWMEYATMKIPCVASRVYPYFMELCGRQTIEDGVTGMLCKPHEWEEKLEKLILDKDLRKKIGESAYEFVKKEWQYDSKLVTELANKALS